MADRQSIIAEFKALGATGEKLMQIEALDDKALMEFYTQVMKDMKAKYKKGGRVGLEEGGSTGSSIQDTPLFELAKYLEELKKKQEEARKKASKKAGGGMVDKSLY